MILLFPLIFLAATSTMTYHIGVLDAKHEAIENNSLCIEHDDATECYALYLEELLK